MSTPTVLPSISMNSRAPAGAAPAEPGAVDSPLLQKALMAATGLVLFGFVLTHMLGNMKVYLGSDDLNHYAEWLREVGSPMIPHGGALWIARGVLLACVGLHMGSAFSLAQRARAAREAGYELHRPLASTYASRTMRFGGIIIVLFVVYHILHLTTGSVHRDFVPGDVYHNFIAGFRHLPSSLFYIVAQLALGLHLSHGIASMLQSLGINHPIINPWRRPLANAFALVITLGNISFPVAVMTGILS
jgi:succinate dehydrogenase / fumarate reductase cytochrome b subunit